MKKLVPVLAIASANVGLVAPALAQSTATATPAAVADWVKKAEADILADIAVGSRSGWIYSSNVTYDTESLVADAGAASIAMQVANAKQAAEYAKVSGLAPDIARKLVMIRYFALLTKWLAQQTKGQTCSW